MKDPINIFYQEPDPDRWLPFDKYPRRLIRRLIRGPQKISGQYLVFFNLIKGLKKLNYPYRINNYEYLKTRPDEIACIIGRDNVLFDNKWRNPIVFGSAFGINPIANPNIFKEYPIKKVLVPGLWLKEMFSAYGKENIEVWPVGIDTDEWAPSGSHLSKPTDFLIYNKIRWFREEMDQKLLNPIKRFLDTNGHTYTELTYGNYKPAQLHKQLKLCKYAIFICEHETQGIAYQQILSSDVPILAWDRGGYWQDPTWYPEQIKFEPVTSVPYWDDLCGVKFNGFSEFPDRWEEFLIKAKQLHFQPRQYIIDNLTLEKCAQHYIDIVDKAKGVVNG